MKRIQQLLGFKDIKGLHTVGLSAIPKKQRSTYLDLYVLIKEKERLEKEIFVLDKRKKTANRQLSAIEKRIEGLKQEMQFGEVTKIPRGESKKAFKTMSIKY